MRVPNFSTSSTIVAALSAAACLAVPVLAGAQQEPYPQQPEQNYPQQQPTYAQPPPAPTYGRQNAIKGTLTAFDGQWIVYMHDDKGYTDHVTLHQGTIINPTGIKLLEGMRVTIYGNPDGPTFQANQVDVAYSPYSPYYGADGNPAPYYGNGYGYGYGYPYSGYGYGYPYGGWPYFGLGIGVNWGWGWGWGWPGWWGGCCGGYYGRGYYGGYPRYPYYPYRGPGYYHGRVGAPAHGSVHGAVPGGGRAPVSGSVHGGGGGRP